MSIWLLILLIFIPMLGSFLYSVFFKPWRVKRFSYFLMRHWNWYRHRVFILSTRAMTKTMNKISIVFTDNFIPALKRATEAMKPLEKALANLSESSK